MQDIINKFPPLPTPPAKLKEELHEARNKCILSNFNTNVAEYVGLIADKSRGLRTLKNVAGTGGTTYYVLERLPGFLAKAAERFSKDAVILEFLTLNIEEDPLAQGFQAESFDLIVCANVLHATRSMQETVAHCRCFLKLGGKLVLSEVTIGGLGGICRGISRWLRRRA
ncbi:class I SAM-dependent methyltransferase [Aspergillus fumigatus Af293]|uniref:PKS-like enzyme, putative n=2 Tax=Aspergillus fumigatus TaxID=746128 RepID=Q4WZ48_ASPFU|nr:PKS-like enzyme, putative [Aspergillus fumigatus Af293]EAL92055.1 PKS-like enzyme, putative [Aspergillus fumigatus Af293]EDP52227.1 PKS-like enzyme, putative [Aspergillus fumigatus A1163]